MNQAAHFDLRSMREIDISTVDPDTLVDIRDTDVDVEKSLIDRALSYLNQIKNPYCFRCGGVSIKLIFAETETSLEDCMEGYFRSL